MKLLTTNQAAKHLGVRPVTLATYRRQGGGPRVTRENGLPRYRLSDLDEYRESRRPRPPAPAPRVASEALVRAVQRVMPVSLGAREKERLAALVSAEKEAEAIAALQRLSTLLESWKQLEFVLR